MIGAVRKKENLHIVLWLLKDFGWIMDFQVLALLMAVPTLFLAGQLCWMTRMDKSELHHNVAVLCWIVANVVWMSGEFFYNDGIRHLAAPFFVLGLLILAKFYLMPLLGASQKEKQV
jgi:hypothetical protein